VGRLSIETCCTASKEGIEETAPTRSYFKDEIEAVKDILYPSL